MKRLLLTIALLGALLGLMAQSAAMAQETQPLAMRIEFEWSVLGALGGAIFGGLLWLTDPANPSNNLADGMAIGAAWGAIGGAGFSVWIMQRNAIFPGQVRVIDPLDPENRITSDPVAQAMGGGRIIAMGGDNQRAFPGIQIQVLKLRF